jgi:hypothetical protein
MKMLQTADIDNQSLVECDVVPLRISECRLRIGRQKSEINNPQSEVSASRETATTGPWN